MEKRKMNRRSTERTSQFFGARHSADQGWKSTQLQDTDITPNSQAKCGIRTSAWLFLLLTLSLIVPSRVAQAQYDTGTLLGAVHDATGAMIPGATISVVNKATGAVFTAVAGNEGEYEVPSLHTGVYKITATHSGFGSSVADNITVSVGERQKIDLTLQVGQSATTVEVSDVALQLETEVGSPGTELEFAL